MNPEPRLEIAPFSASQQGRIDDLRSAFEAAYLSGERPSVERFLEDTPPAERPAALRELLLLALDYSQMAGETPSRADYVARFPDRVDVVHQVFDEIESRPGGEKLRSTVPMARPAPQDGEMRLHADRNLLFGILALQNNFIDRHALIAAFDRWTTDKRKTLGAILVDFGKLDPLRHRLLDALVAQHLKLHDGDAEKSLATVSSLGSVRNDLEQLADPDVQESLAGVLAAQSKGAPTIDPHAVTAPVGTKSSAGSRFTVLRPYATGGLGQVSVALDEELDREVAFKEIQDRYADDSGARSRFLLEAQITGALEHPGVVPVYGLGHFAGGRPFYAMRLIQGESFQAAIKRFHGASGGRQPPVADVGTRNHAIEFRQLLGRFVDVCNAIEYAHSRGVLHRDLKPGNVMLGKYGETLVVDWGLAKVVGRAEAQAAADEPTLRPASADDSAPTLAGQAVGTPQYMSPEQAAGRRDLLSRASDVYGLGATLYSLLTGQPPFERSETSEVIARVARGDFRPPREIKPETPRALDAICLKAMRLNPSERYKSARALADDVERWLADEPVAARREPFAERAGRWLRRHRAAVRAAALALVAVTAILSVALVLVDGARNATEQANARLDRTNARLTTANNELTTANHMAMGTLKSVIFEVQRGLEGVPGTSGVRRKLLDAALARLRQVSDTYVKRAEIDRSTLVAVSELGDLLLEFGDTRVDGPEPGQAGAGESAEGHSAVEAALALYQRAHEMASRLAEADRANVQAQRDLLTSRQRLGDAYLRLGRSEEALAEYQQMAESTRRLAEADPGNAQAQRDVWVAHIKLGDVYHLQLGRTDEALAEFQQGLEIVRKLAVADGANAQAQRDLAISHQRLGDVYLRLSRSEEALQEYQQHIDVVRTLAEAEPANAQIQGDLLTSHEKLGDVYRELGRGHEALDEYSQQFEIIRTLAEADPANVQVQRGLSVSHNKLGDVYLQLGRSDEALREYLRELEISRRLAEADRANAQAQRDLSTSYNNLGDVYVRLARIDDALREYQRCLEVSQKLAKAGPANAQAQRDVMVCWFKLGTVEQGRFAFKQAAEQYRRGLAVLDAFAEQSGVQPFENDVAALKAQMQICELAERVIDDVETAAALPAEQAAAVLMLRGQAMLKRRLPAEAVASARRLAQIEPPTGTNLYNAACLASLASAAVAGDVTVAQADRAKTADEYAATAVEMLGRAAKFGFFDGPANLAHFGKDSDFDALRRRGEFIEFVEELRNPSARKDE